VPRVEVAVVVDAPPRRVWADVADVASHVEWMADAVDRMEVTEWRPGRAMGVRHTGLVTGEGRFTLHRARGGRTRFTWEERLVFPWWLGGPVGATVGSVVLRRVWAGNLRRLKQRIEGRPA
jgi:uncharacterized protein YndB with AHSA1/START domain